MHNVVTINIPNIEEGGLIFPDFELKVKSLNLFLVKCSIEQQSKLEIDIHIYWHYNLELGMPKIYLTLNTTKNGY